MNETLVQPKSTHFVEVFELKELLPHPNAERLSLIKIGNTQYTYCANTEEWKLKVPCLVAWIPPDSIVDRTRPEFSWLEKDRVKAKRLRGIVSYGLLVPAPAGLQPGDNAADVLGVKHYDPEEEKAKIQGPNRSYLREIVTGPTPQVPKYDVDAFLKYGQMVFTEGESVWITEKIHGANGCFIYENGQQYCRSRSEFKLEYPEGKMTLEEFLRDVYKGDNPAEGEEIYKTRILPKIESGIKKQNLWWRVFRQYPQIAEFCKKFEGSAIYGEVYGNVQSLRYGTTGDEVKFAAFDIRLPSGSWLNPVDFLNTCSAYQIPVVPTLAINHPIKFDELSKFAEGKSTLADHIREGCVIKPMIDRWDERLGRVSLKLINPEYLEKN